MQEQPDTRPDGPCENARRILVIDDDADITEIIYRALHNKHNRVVTMNQMEVVLDSPWSLENCDIAIVDLFMPGIGGIEGIRRIREQNPVCKIIAISGGWGEMNIYDALSAAEKIGADMVLAKPFRINDIRETVRQVLAGLSMPSPT